MRVVLDTNVLVSALIKQNGNPDRILRMAGDRYQLVSSTFILAELERTLARRRIRAKYQVETTPERTMLFIATARVMSDIVTPATLLTVVSDPQDNPVLACAVDGSAEYFVTGDRRLLALEKYQHAQIATPNDFLTLLRSFG